MTKKILSMLLCAIISVSVVIPMMTFSVGAASLSDGEFEQIIEEIFDNCDGTETLDEILMKIADALDTRLGLNLSYEVRVAMAKAMYEELIKDKLSGKGEETKPTETQPVETQPVETEPTKPEPVPVQEETFINTTLEYGDTFVLSNAEFNNVIITVKNNVLTVSGTLSCSGLDRMSVNLYDIKREDSMLYFAWGIASGSRFEYSVKLSDYPNLPSELILRYYTRTTESKDGSCWSPAFDFVVLKKVDGQYKIPVTPLIERNEESLSAYINPYLSINVKPSTVINQQAAFLCRGLEDDYHKAYTIYTWVCKNIAYNRDYADNKSTYNPVSLYDIFTNKLASVRGMSDILEALLEAAGIPAIITTFDAHNAEYVLAGKEAEYSQYGVEAYVNGRWIVMFPFLDHNAELIDGKTVITRPRAYSYFDLTMQALSANFYVYSRRTEQAQNIPSDWAIPEVLAANAEDIVPDIIQSSYKNSITRSEFCALIMQMLRVKHGVNDVKALLAIYSTDYSENFYDTDSENVNGAYLLGIVSGRGDGMFDPYSTLTRQEAAVMLANTARFLGLAPSTKMNISDLSSADSWAHDAIKTVTGLVASTGKTVMNGVDLTCFGPKDKYTREQSILTVYRLFMCE